MGHQLKETEMNTEMGQQPNKNWKKLKRTLKWDSNRTTTKRNWNEHWNGIPTLKLKLEYDNWNRHQNGTPTKWYTEVETKNHSNDNWNENEKKNWNGTQTKWYTDVEARIRQLKQTLKIGHQQNDRLKLKLKTNWTTTETKMKQTLIWDTNQMIHWSWN